MNILKAMKRSTLGLDLYLWLTYRTFALKRSLRLSWPRLYRQFGSDPAKANDTRTVDNFRTDCLRELKKIKTPGRTCTTRRLRRVAALAVAAAYPAGTAPSRGVGLWDERLKPTTGASTWKIQPRVEDERCAGSSSPVSSWSPTARRAPPASAARLKRFSARCRRRSRPPGRRKRPSCRAARCVTRRAAAQEARSAGMRRLIWALGWPQEPRNAGRVSPSPSSAGKSRLGPLSASDRR